MSAVRAVSIVLTIPTVIVKLDITINIVPQIRLLGGHNILPVFNDVKWL